MSLCLLSNNGANDYNVFYNAFHNISKTYEEYSRTLAADGGSEEVEVAGVHLPGHSYFNIIGANIRIEDTLLFNYSPYE